MDHDYEESCSPGICRICGQPHAPCPADTSLERYEAALLAAQLLATDAPLPVLGSALARRRMARFLGRALRALAREAGGPAQLLTGPQHTDIALAAKQATRRLHDLADLLDPEGA